MVAAHLPTFLVVTVLVGHFIGDFVLQSDNVAKRKSRDFTYLSIHVILYGLGLAANTACLLWEVTLGSWLLWLGANLVLHWLTDAVTSRCTAALQRAGQTHWFFVMIGFDQLVHAVTLVTTLSYLLN